jgi:hypothetical protein
MFQIFILPLCYSCKENCLIALVAHINTWLMAHVSEAKENYNKG